MYGVRLPVRKPTRPDKSPPVHSRHKNCCQHELAAIMEGLVQVSKFNNRESHLPIAESSATPKD
jgi:hypothetical protein